MAILTEQQADAFYDAADTLRDIDRYLLEHGTDSKEPSYVKARLDTCFKHCSLRTPAQSTGDYVAIFAQAILSPGKFQDEIKNGILEISEAMGLREEVENALEQGPA